MERVLFLPRHRFSSEETVRTEGSTCTVGWPADRSLLFERPSKDRVVVLERRVGLPPHNPFSVPEFSTEVVRECEDYELIGFVSLCTDGKAGNPSTGGTVG